MSLLIKGGAAEIGGLYGINVEVLGAAKTLTAGTDEIYQYLDPGAANRLITLATAGAAAGDRFIVRHNGAAVNTFYLEVKQGASDLDRVFASAVKEFIFDGTNWITRGVGTGENNARQYQVGIGCRANPIDYGTAVGYNADAHAEGVAVGYNSSAYDMGVAVGQGAIAFNYGVAVGLDTYGYDFGTACGENAFGDTYGLALGYEANTASKHFSIAFGYRAECIRYAETSTNIDGDPQQYNNVVQGRWAKTTADAVPIEIFCGGVANQRFIVRASSVLAFRMIITARDNVAGHVAMYTVDDGLIKRDAANNTAMALAAVVTVVFEDDAAWDVTVTADDANEALIITVTGDAANPTKWAVRMDGVETHF